jgi:hypothetical protein
MCQQQLAHRNIDKRVDDRQHCIRGLEMKNYFLVTFFRAECLLKNNILRIQIFYQWRSYLK